MHFGNQREVGDSQVQGRLGTKRIQRITAEKTFTANIGVAPVMPVRQTGAAASKTMEFSGTAETSNIMFHHELQNPSEIHSRKADANEFFGDTSFQNYTIAAQQGRMEEYLASFQEELDNATLRAKEHAIQRTNYVAERKSTGHTLAQRLSISVGNERELGHEIRHQQQVEAAERGLVTDIHHLLPVGVHARTREVSRVLHQGAAGIQTEVDALGYWQKDNPYKTIKMDPENVDILHSTTHRTRVEDHRTIPSMTGASTQLPIEKLFTSSEKRQDSALELSPGSQEMDHSEDPMPEITQDHPMSSATDERKEFLVTSEDDIGNMKREIELSMENEKVSFRAQLRRDLEGKLVEGTVQEKHEKSTAKSVKTKSTVSQITSRKSETKKLKRDSKISIHSITEQVNKSAWSSQRHDSSHHAKPGHEQGVVTATSVLSSKKHPGKVVLAKTDILAGKKRSIPVKPEAMAVEPSSDIVEAHQPHRDVPFATTTNMETSKSNIHAQDTSQIPVTTKLNPKEFPEEFEAQSSDEILEKNTESRKSKAFSAFFTALDIREGESENARPLESTEPMEQQAENMRALHCPRGTATRTEIMQEDYFTRVDGIQRPRKSEKPGFSVYFRSKESASDDATDSYNSLQVMPPDGNVDTGIIELDQTLGERHERRDTSSAGIQRKLTSVEAAMKTEVSAGLHEAHCDHADFSDYTILDPTQTNPTEKLD